MSSIQTTETERDWAKEFKVGEDGKISGSRKGAARLCGVDSRAIARLVKSLNGGGTRTQSKPLQPFIGQDFEGGDLPELLMSAIVVHYAFKGVDDAQTTLIAMTAIGLRVFLQRKLGWSQADRVVEPVPTQLILPPVPEIPPRNLARKLVDDRARITGLQHSFLWNQAYHELEYRFGYAIARSRAKNKLEKIEADGQLPNLIATMQVVWGVEA